jgi:ubiquitin-conjugating enzyme E2 R
MAVPRLTRSDFKFIRPIFHPNIYPDGKLCISILHAPGEDIMSGELASERWTPVQRTESVLISILSLLDDAEVSSPANVDAGVMLRKEPEKFKMRVREVVEASKKDIPESFVMPTHESTKPPVVEKYDDDFWADSDADNSFGGSDSDEDMNHDDDEDDEEEDEDDQDDDDEDDDEDSKVKECVEGDCTPKRLEVGDSEMTDHEEP